MSWGSPDGPAGDLPLAGCPDPGDGLRFLAVQPRLAGHDDALVEVFLQHLLRDAQVFVLLSGPDVDVGDGPDDPLGGADVDLEAFCDVRGGQQASGGGGIFFVEVCHVVHSLSAVSVR